MVELKLIGTKDEYELAKTIVQTYHSYVPNFNTVGRSINYFIYDDGEMVGVIGLGSSTYPPCKDMLTYLNLTKEEYKEKFNNFANNWRFCLMSGRRNLGTEVLKQFRKQSAIDWYDKYGDNLECIFTFVGGGHDGAVYKADNWSEIGSTAGLPKHNSISMKWDDKEALKKKFVKPTGENKKTIFAIKLKPIKRKRVETTKLW